MDGQRVEKEKMADYILTDLYPSGALPYSKGAPFLDHWSQIKAPRITRRSRGEYFLNHTEFQTIVYSVLRISLMINATTSERPHECSKRQAL